MFGLPMHKGKVPIEPLTIFSQEDDSPHRNCISITSLILSLTPSSDMHPYLALLEDTFLMQG
jgi:hypothetical protein